ncbi:phage tail protein [Pseudomonas aeruginosa]
MSQTYFALLTAVGEAKLANAAAFGTQLQISRMAVGDGNGNLPVPSRTQTALINERYRADLNELKVDPNNASQIIAELVIPETEGGYWLREMGLYDFENNLIAVANCPPSYKPQMAEGSGRTQVLRMVLVVSSTAAVQLKIDPSVVLATRDFVTTTVAAALAKLDGKDSVKVATTANLAALSGLLTVDDVVLAAGDRVLVKDQATASQNGIYVAAAGAWSRAADADSSAEVTPGMTVPVEQGTTHADTIWELTTNAPITLGTTALAFELTAALNATQSDAEGGTNNTRRMTALRVFQALRSAAALATETLRGALRVGTQQEVDAGLLDDVALTPKKLKAAFLSSLNYIGHQRLQGGQIEQWGTVTLTSVGAFNAQVVGGVTWYTHFYEVPLPIAYTEKHFEVIATLAGRPNLAQAPARLAMVQTNKTTSGPGESLSGFTVSVTTPETGWVPTIHFHSKGK